MNAHLAFMLGIRSSNFHLHNRCHVCVYLHLMFQFEHCLSIGFELKTISSFGLRTVFTCFRSIHREVDRIKIAHVALIIGKTFSANTYLVLS